MYQAWNNWALVSVAESKTSFESTKKKKCLVFRAERDGVASCNIYYQKQFYILGIYKNNNKNPL